MVWQTLPQECKHVLVGREYMGWQTLPQECKHVLVGRELVIAFGARPTFGGEPPKPPELTTNIAS